jgi:Fur family peroxide stress response transcriptional regulator
LKTTPCRDTAGPDLAAFTEFCRRQGIKPTRQRIEIYRELRAREDHPSAEIIYGQVKKRLPAISLDTVYRTLRLFEQQGIISRVSAPGESMRFDGNLQHHHHFICTECGSVRDFYSDAFDSLTAPEQVVEFGDIRSVHVEVRGVCHDCRNKTGEKPPPSP